MRALVVDSNKSDREVLARHLTEAGHAVECARDTQGATKLLTARAPDVAVIDWNLEGAAKIVRQLRSLATCGHTYIVTMSSGRVATDLAGAVRAGADDHFFKPVLREELLFRISAMERLPELAKRLDQTPSAQSKDKMLSVVGERAWDEAPAVVMKDVGDMLQEEMQVVAHGEGLADIAYGAELALTLASEELELRIAVGVGASSLKQLAGTIFGDPNAPESAQRDIVREMANLAAGAIKRAALDEGAAFTIGLPFDTDFARRRETFIAEQEFVLRGSGSATTVALRLTAISKGLTRVCVADLREGMVLARDLLNDVGNLLAPAGTRLTTSHITRLGRVLAAKAAIEVAEAA